MKELIDALDENGNKTGEILTRKQIHEQGIWHKIVAVAIIDKNGNILLQQRSKNRAKNPLKWDVSAAGHVSSGQTTIEAAIRETSEEIGIDLKEEELKYVITYKEIVNVEENYNDRQIYDCYILEKDKIDISNIKIQESEVEQVKLCNLKEFEEIVESKNITNTIIEMYKEIIKYLK